MKIESIIIGIAGIIFWPLTMYLLKKYFDSIHESIKNLREDFKSFCREIPCDEHSGRIAFLEGKLNGAGKRTRQG